MTDRLPMAVEDQTEVGSYFVANYPPFSTWTKTAVERDGKPALRSSPVVGTIGSIYAPSVCQYKLSKDRLLAVTRGCG